MLKVLQLNLNHCAVAQDLLPQLVREEKADIVIISEEYRDLEEPSWVRDSTSRTAIWVCGHISRKIVTPLPNFTQMEIAGVRFYSCYLPPSDTIEDFTRSLDAIVASAQSSRLPVVIVGDFNAWATEWGSARTTVYRRLLLEAFSTLELKIANRGTTPTYAKSNKSSIVDLTIIDPIMGERHD